MRVQELESLLFFPFVTALLLRTFAVSINLMRLTEEATASAVLWSLAFVICHTSSLLSCAHGRIRTYDLLLRRQTFSPLNYVDKLRRRGVLAISLTNGRRNWCGAQHGCGFGIGANHHDRAIALQYQPCRAPRFTTPRVNWRYRAYIGRRNWL